jgi:cyclopropane fatty-acyl-phospholipid synthase-like methyltransferase
MMSKFLLQAESTLAADSYDHTNPCGTKWDNSRNPKFNEKLFALLKKTNFQKPYKVMDLGCSGGGFVKDMIDAGHEAVGLEGSDYSLKLKRAEWATIPDNLFTCDITRPFRVLSVLYDAGPDAETVGDDAKFDVVTAWELMEHISEAKLPQMLKNLKDHMSERGIFVCSVSPNHDPWHVTVYSHGWWNAKFEEHGLVNHPDLVAYFGDDWVRGPNQGAPNSFHFVLTKAQ